MSDLPQRLDAAGMPARCVELAAELAPHYRDGEVLAILGNIVKETGFTRLEENLDYSRTPVQRIRVVFGQRLAHLSDAQVMALAKSPQGFAEAVYGGDFGRRYLGNTQAGDGWRFRGMGDIQLTGRGNYTAASRGVFGDDRLIKSPDLVKQVKSSAAVMRWYFGARVPSMAKRLGVDAATADQAGLNLVYTSAVAGSPLKRGAGYGGELVAKVDAWVNGATAALV